MTDISFSTTISVDGTPSAAFDAICDVRGWWGRDVEGPTDELGAEFTYRGEDLHYSRIKVTELVRGERVAWHVLDNYMTFVADQDEWIGTDIIFDLTPQGDTTQISFRHVGLLPRFECFEVCFDAWTFFVTDSLPALITTGTGKPLAVHDGPQRVGRRGLVPALR